MTGKQMGLKKSVTALLMGNLGQEVDIEYRRKVILLNLVCFVGTIVLIPMAALAFMESNRYLGTFDFIMAGVLISNIIYLRKTGYYRVFIYSSVISAMIFYMFLFFFGGVNNTAFVWYYTFPLFSLFLLGSLPGSILTFILFSGALIFFLVNPTKPYFATYHLDLKLRFIPSFITTYIFAYVFEYLRDKTQKKLEASRDYLAEEKTRAEKASKAKSEFLANMSHELRTPLNHIIGFTELIVDKNFGDLNDTQEEYLNDVLTSSRHLLSLINDILDLSKVEAGKLELDPANVDLRAILENSITMIKEKSLKHGIKVSLEVDEIPDTIHADERKLKQILYNLLSNAVKFTPDGGEIRIAAGLKNNGNGSDLAQGTEITRGDQDTSPKYVCVSVSDTGIGIKENDLDRIFDPFEQVESSTSRTYQGTGLGLSLTKRLVELHGGNIWAESEGKEKGSTFNFLLPIRNLKS